MRDIVTYAGFLYQSFNGAASRRTRMHNAGAGTFHSIDMLQRSRVTTDADA